MDPPSVQKTVRNAVANTAGCKPGCPDGRRIAGLDRRFVKTLPGAGGKACSMMAEFRSSAALRSETATGKQQAVESWLRAGSFARPHHEPMETAAARHREAKIKAGAATSFAKKGRRRLLFCTGCAITASHDRK